jgi:hypothetical protein
MVPQTCTPNFKPGSYSIAKPWEQFLQQTLINQYKKGTKVFQHSKSQASKNYYFIKHTTTNKGRATKSQNKYVRTCQDSHQRTLAVQTVLEGWRPVTIRTKHLSTTLVKNPNSANEKIGKQPIFVDYDDIEMGEKPLQQDAADYSKMTINQFISTKYKIGTPPTPIFHQVWGRYLVLDNLLYWNNTKVWRKYYYRNYRWISSITCQLKMHRRYSRTMENSS